MYPNHTHCSLVPCLPLSTVASPSTPIYCPYIHWNLVKFLVASSLRKEASLPASMTEAIYRGQPGGGRSQISCLHFTTCTAGLWASELWGEFFFHGWDQLSYTHAIASAPVKGRTSSPTKGRASPLTYKTSGDFRW